MSGGAVDFTAIHAAGYHDLVPVIPPGAILSPHSAITSDQLGKIPGRKNAMGFWSGYAWQKAPAPSRGEVERWQRDGANLGLRGEKFPAVDCDCDAPELAERVLAIAARVLGAGPVRMRGTRGLLICRSDAPLRKQRVAFLFDGQPQAIELLGAGQQYLVAGTHRSGTPYTYPGQRLDTTPPEHLPVLTVEAFATIIAAVRAEFAERITEMSESKSGDQHDVNQASLCGDLEDVRAWVAAIPNDVDRDGFLRMGAAIKASLPDHPGEAEALFAEWCDRWVDGANAPEYVEQTWRSLRPPFQLGAAWLREEARKHDPALAAEPFTVSDEPPPTTATPAASRVEIPVLGWAELGAVSEASWLVDRVFPRDTITSIWGASRAFKSFLAIHLGLHIATGRPWFGRATQQGPVVFLVGEGANGFRKRAYAAADALGIVDPPIAIVPCAFDLTDPKIVRAVCARLADLHPVAVFVDTYFRYAPGRDHNKQVDHSVMMAGLDHLRSAFGAMVCVLDHGTKDVQDVRGPGGTVHKFAGYDTILMMQREGDALLATLTMQKQKDAEELAPFLVTLTRHAGSLVCDSTGTWAEEAAPPTGAALRTSEERALAALAEITVEDGEAMSWSHWQEAAQLSKTTFLRVRKHLVGRGLVEKVGGKYRVSRSGHDRLRQSRPDPMAAMGLAAEEDARAIDELLGVASHDAVLGAPVGTA